MWSRYEKRGVISMGSDVEEKGKIKKNNEGKQRTGKQGMMNEENI